MLSEMKVNEILKKKGINIERILSDPGVYERASDIIYKSIPIPLRWFIGRKTARKFVNVLKASLLTRDRKI